jgi:plasmid stabilization system protein ParE
MTNRVFQTAAVTDLDEIVDYLSAKAGEQVALRYALAFQVAFDRIRDLPASGSPRPRLGPETRSIGVSPYLIFYDFDATADQVHVLRILHSRRNIQPSMLWP